MLKQLTEMKRTNCGITSDHEAAVYGAVLVMACIIILYVTTTICRI